MEKTLDEQIIGLTVFAAGELLKNQGLMVRCTKMDGNGLICTRDFRQDRVNVEVVEGYITKILDIG